MKSLRSLARSLRARWEAFKGPPMLRVVNVHQDPRDGYLVKTNTGQFIEIFCRELVHEMTYSRWWIPIRRVRMYQVYSHCSSDMSEALRAKLDEDFTVESPLRSYATRAEQKKAAIDCYIDLVLSHLRLV